MDLFVWFWFAKNCYPVQASKETLAACSAITIHFLGVHPFWKKIQFWLKFICLKSGGYPVLGSPIQSNQKPDQCTEC